MTTTPPDDQQPSGDPTPPPPPAPETPPPPAPPAYEAPAAPAPPPAYQAPGGQYGAPPPAPAYGSTVAGAPLSDSDQRLWATLAHILPLIGLSIVPPLVVWLVFKGRGQFLEEQAKEALNFQITLLIASVAITIISVITLGIGSILFLAFIVAVVFMIMAAVAANKGEAYRYPVNIRLIK
ncbi:DUF4870 domain-containing protein [Actinotalea sp. K2]|uniref:DUF4870 domain-containing protein n=1 Tax=Actinotalea sp. K2 TaxID=2939438 RepID=UPI002017B0B0|nr:DUF4870 domain-containing protein [Actinotalea sp. K2]MCL3860586.1 DUF4870 domain-containing protein [Actinotalea sp. K2]